MSKQGVRPAHGEPIYETRESAQIQDDIPLPGFGADGILNDLKPPTAAAFVDGTDPVHPGAGAGGSGAPPAGPSPAAPRPPVATAGRLSTTDRALLRGFGFEPDGVADLQRFLGVEPTGNFGRVTREAARERFREAQTCLRTLGLYTGRPDGIPGPRSTDALTRFQAAHELPTTGIVDQATLDALREAARNAGAGS